MTASRRHPSADRWLAWIQGENPDAQPEALESHLAECAGCRALVDTLRSLPARQGRKSWALPSDDLVDQVARMPRGKRTRRPEKPLVFGWNAPDVRGGGSAVADDARIVARSCPAGEISVLSFPAADDGRTRIEGRVWLRNPSKEPVSVVLAHEDHVIVQIEALDGEPFASEEVLAPGWQIEIHFPSGETVVLGDPFAED